MTDQKLVFICLTGDLSTDYRVHKTSLSLVKMGYEVRCISRIKPGFGEVKKQSYGVRILNTLFKQGALFYAEMNVRVFWYLILNRSDVVLAIDLDTLPACWLATRLRRRALVFDSHELFPEVPELQHRPIVKKAWIMLERFLVPKADKVYTVCESIADIYRAKYHIKVDVVRNLPLAERATDSEKILYDERFIILYQGAVNLGRGIFETLEAMKLLDDVVFVIIGDGDEINQVKQFIAENKLQSKVLVLGKIPFDQLSGYTVSANVGLCLLENIGLNYYYSLPNRIFDFALAGVPVLASRFPEIEKIVDTCQTGTLIGDLKPQTIADAVIELKENHSLWQKMSSNAKNASKDLVWEKEEAVLESIFKF